MKKTYSKPEIMFESFALSTNIAGDCSVRVNNHTEGICPMLGTGGIAVFNSNMNQCVYTSTDIGGGVDEYDGICYHVPINGQNLFNS